MVKQIKGLDNKSGYVELDEILKIAQSAKISPHNGQNTFLSKIKSIFNRSKYSHIPPLIEQIELDIEKKYADLEITQKCGRRLSFGTDIKPLKGKDQDVIETFVMKDQSVGIILCDGISGEGENSGTFAREFAKGLKTYFLQNYKLKASLHHFQAFLEKAISDVQVALNLDSGGTTLIFAFYPSDHKLLFLSYQGDGHAYMFNRQMTGFSKLLIPSRDKQKHLVSAITAAEIIGRPLTQIHFIEGETLVIASDGYELSNGKVLNHLYKEVLAQDSFTDSLMTWTGENCCDQIDIHGRNNDDRSIAIMRAN